MELQELKKLIEKYNAGQASADEKAFVENWYESVNGPEADLSSSQVEILKGKIRFELDKQTTERRTIQSGSSVKIIKRWMSWAAILMIVGGISFYFYLDSPIKRVEKSDKVAANGNSIDIQPGGNKATLTLANGNQIILNDVDDGVLLNEGNITVQKMQDGQVVYKAISATSPYSDVKYNTIATPRGGQYHIVLSDGTKVWLNATSSLKFPAVFNGEQRNVEVIGEAYFEVAKNKEKPFHVKVGSTEIEVLGTHFNVMAYADEENQETTLLEGSVRVSVNGSDARVLVPGQQAKIGINQNNIEVLNVDVERTIAWQNGYFQFNRSGIKEVMNSLARWYDIEVVYEGKVPSDEFVGKIRREATLSQALNILKLSKVKFYMEGRKIFIGKED